MVPRIMPSSTEIRFNYLHMRVHVEHPTLPISFNIANILDKIPRLHSCISTVFSPKMVSE